MQEWLAADAAAVLAGFDPGPGVPAGPVVDEAALQRAREIVGRVL